MRDIVYKYETLMNLACILFNKEQDAIGKSDAVLTRIVAEALVPWHRRDDVIPKEDFVETIKSWLRLSFEEYHGSPQGYASVEAQQWTIYAILWGNKVADSLIALESRSDVTVSYENGKFSIDVPGTKKTMRGVCFTDKMAKWCRRMCPAVFYNITDTVMIDFMDEAYRKYGAFKMSLPAEPSYTDEEFEGIYSMVLGSNYKRGSLERTCMLDWCLKNAPEATVREYADSSDWDGLCTAMQGIWEEQIKNVKVEQ